MDTNWKPKVFKNEVHILVHLMIQQILLWSITCQIHCLFVFIYMLTELSINNIQKLKDKIRYQISGWWKYVDKL